MEDNKSEFPDAKPSQAESLQNDPGRGIFGRFLASVSRVLAGPANMPESEDEFGNANNYFRTVFDTTPYDSLSKNSQPTPPTTLKSRRFAKDEQEEIHY